jgi:hypothetical protein
VVKITARLAVRDIKHAISLGWAQSGLRSYHQSSRTAQSATPVPMHPKWGAFLIGATE